MKALILAAGKAASLVPFSGSRPAPMVKLCGRYVLELTLELLREAGVGDVVLVIDGATNRIPETLGDGSEYGLSIQYVSQRGEGIGGAVLDAEQALGTGEHFLLVYGDTLTRENLFAQVLQSHHEHRAPVAAICLTEHPERYGNVYMSGDMRITRIVDRPQQALGNYVLAGAFVLPRTLLGHLRAGEQDMYAALEATMTAEALRAAIWERDWVDLRYPWDILSANRTLMGPWQRARVAASARISEAARISGPVWIEEEVRIEAGAVLRGPCYIGPGSYIGNNSLIRPYTSLGAQSVIGFGVELKNAVLMDGSRIGRLSFVGDSVVGENVDIGAGTMTINRLRDDGMIAVSIGGEAIDTRLRKVGAFVGDRATLGTGHCLAPGSIVEQDAVVESRISYPVE